MTKTEEAAKPAAEKEGRPALSAKDEKELKAIAGDYLEDDLVVRYARKVLKFRAGLRGTPAPIPAELDKGIAEAIRARILPESAKSSKPGELPADPEKA